MRDQIRVKGVLDSGWSTWFDGLWVTSDASGQTTSPGRSPTRGPTHTDMEASDAEDLNSQAQS